MAENLFRSLVRWLFSVLMVGTLIPPALAVDLSVRKNTEHMTPVSDIQANRIQTPAVHPATLSEPTGVEKIQTLETRPSEHTDEASPEATDPTTLKPPVEPAFVVFPVMLHQNKNKAFADLPILLSSAVANQLTQKIRKEGLFYPVLNPIYSYDELREKGLDGLYERIVKDYLQAGIPNEKDLLYLTDHLSTSDRQATWVVFVDAEFDTNHMTTPVGFEKKLATLLDLQPGDPNYLLKATVQVFSAQDGLPLIWNRSGSYRVKLSSFHNFTKSIYDDSDSAINFRYAANKLAGQMIGSIPRKNYLLNTMVQASLVDAAKSPAGKTNR